MRRTATATKKTVPLLILTTGEGDAEFFRAGEDGSGVLMRESVSCFNGDPDAKPRDSQHATLLEALEALDSKWQTWGVDVLDPSIEAEFIALGGLTPKLSRDRRLGRAA